MVHIARLTLLSLVLAASAQPAADDPYIAGIQKFRQQQDEFWQSERSPLHLVGRFKVGEGTSTAGSDPASTFVFPFGAPLHVGKLIGRGRTFTYEPVPGVPAAINGKPVSGLTELHVTQSPAPADRISVGDFVFAVRPIADEFYLLVTNMKGLATEFKGTTWFPINPAYKVDAQFVPYEQAQKVSVPDTVGSQLVMTASGDVVFQLAGESLRLKAFDEGDHLFVMFRDETSGRETYGGGRFLETSKPDGARTVLDFNKAYNPYCALAPYAVCPIPSRESRLPVRIEAGETYRSSH